MEIPHNQNKPTCVFSKSERYGYIYETYESKCAVMENMKIPDIVKNEVKKIDKEARVILFGSRARGDHSGESDWDFLILLSLEDTETIKREIRDKLFEIEIETDEIISSLIENQKKWNDYKVTPLFKKIEKEGLLI